MKEEKKARSRTLSGISLHKSCVAGHVMLAGSLCVSFLANSYGDGQGTGSLSVVGHVFS